MKLHFHLLFVYVYAFKKSDLLISASPTKRLHHLLHQQQMILLHPIDFDSNIIDKDLDYMIYHVSGVLQLRDMHILAKHMANPIKSPKDSETISDSHISLQSTTTLSSSHKPKIAS